MIELTDDVDIEEAINNLDTPDGVELNVVGQEVEAVISIGDGHRDEVILMDEIDPVYDMVMDYYNE